MISEAPARRRHDRRRSATRRVTEPTPGLLVRHRVLLGLFCATILIRPTAAADPRDTLLSLLAQMEASYARVNDYTAVFRKQERLDGTLLPEETTFLKFQKPLKVYMIWVEAPFKGMEVLFVDGDHNKLLVHRNDILGFLTVSLDPKGSVAMRRNRHPITEVGFGHLIDGLQRNIKTALQHGEFQITRLAEEPFKGRAATVVEAKFTPRSGRTYYASRMVCHIDKELRLPIGAALYDEKDNLFERYSYSDVRLNLGLTSLDFSRENKAYRF